MTNPLGGITLDHLRRCRQQRHPDHRRVQQRHGRPQHRHHQHLRRRQPGVSTTVDPGASLAASHHPEHYDPNGNVFCTVSANAFAAGTPPTSARPGRPPGSPARRRPASAVLDDHPTSARPTTSPPPSTTPTATSSRPPTPTSRPSINAFDADGRTYCTSDPTNVAAWLTAHSSGTYPYLCPSHPADIAPRRASTTGLHHHHLRRRRPHAVINRPGRRHHLLHLRPGRAHADDDRPPGQGHHQLLLLRERLRPVRPLGAPPVAASGDDLYSTVPPRPPRPTPAGETTTYTYYPGGQADDHHHAGRVPPPTPTTPTATSTSVDLLGHGHRVLHAGQRRATPTTWTAPGTP